MTIFLIIWIFIVGLVWFFLCNQKTLRQRVAIIDARPKLDGPDWQKNLERSRQALEAFDSVTYDQHFWALLTFHDPAYLYPRIIWEQMGWIETGIMV